MKRLILHSLEEVEFFIPYFTGIKQYLQIIWGQEYIPITLETTLLNNCLLKFFVKSNKSSDYDLELEATMPTIHRVW
jgi:hypothetical protein